MYPKPSVEVERRRITVGRLASTASYGNNGAFRFELTPERCLNVVASDGRGWEHVSVSVASSDETPTWSEMCLVKDAFWQPEEAVFQFHPPQSKYINIHPGTLHLWRPTTGPSLPMPPLILV